MRLVTWNCGGGLQRKLDTLLELKPDVAVIQEACAPDRLQSLASEVSAVWIGRLQHKGLLVLGFDGWSVSPAEGFPTDLEWVLPVDVTGILDFTLVGVWAMNHRASNSTAASRHVSQALTAMEQLDRDAAARLVVAGDFNNNLIWDTPKRTRFGGLIRRYADLGLVSAYHHSSGDVFGQELTPTHWWRDRREDGPTYHLDYVFAPQRWMSAADLRIGTFEESVTLGRSDHAPIVFDLDVSRIPS